MEYSGNSLPRCGIWWQLAAQVWNIVALHCPGVGIWWHLAAQVWNLVAIACPGVEFGGKWLPDMENSGTSLPRCRNLVAIGYPGVENSGDWLPKYERQSAAQGLKSVEGLAICMS